MKKNTLYISAAILLSGIMLTSCLEDDGCKICRQNTYQSGTIVNEGTPVEYCGDGLTDIETSEPVTINGVTTQYDCE